MADEAVPGLEVFRDRHHRWVITLDGKRKVTRRKRSMRRLVRKVNELRRWPR